MISMGRPAASNTGETTVWRCRIVPSGRHGLEVPDRPVWKDESPLARDARSLADHSFDFFDVVGSIFGVDPLAHRLGRWNSGVGIESADSQELRRPVFQRAGLHVQDPAPRVTEPLRFRQPGLASPQGLLRLAPEVQHLAEFQLLFLELLLGLFTFLNFEIHANPIQ